MSSTRLSLLTSTPSTSSGRGRRRPPRLLVAALVLVTSLATVSAGLAGNATAAPVAQPPTAAQPDLGPNVRIFDPGMPTSKIQAAVDAITAQQVGNEMGTQRYSLLFEPGTYGTAAEPLIIQVGYYTEVAGLGASPTDVTINGHVDVYNQCGPDGTNCIALNNFWRSVSNLTINVMGGAGCRSKTTFWAVSQAAPMRRVNVTGGTLSLMDYCSGPAYASGGFIADSRAVGTVVNGSQQQFLVRDSTVGQWSNGVWNQVFAGVEGAPAQSFPTPPYTTLATNPASREKPYLYRDGPRGYAVFVPDARTASSGTTWASSPTAGHSIPLSAFYVTRPGDSARTINRQLARGKNLLVTPGVYDIDRSIEVKRPDTVVLALGIATLTAVGGAVPIRVADVGGVDIAGLMIDAGVTNSPTLLQVGSSRDKDEHADDHGRGGDRGDSGRGSAPTALQDVFFRVGGPHAGRATTTLEINSDHVIVDDIWAWRADHGQGVGWDLNTSDTGVVVNGDDVTATGLFSEHFQKDNVIWNGERGRTVFFQNELPYDAPDQASWQHDGILGYAAYRVGASVRQHELWGGGSYIFCNVDPTLHASSAFQVPRRPGVRLHDLSTVVLNRDAQGRLTGTIDNVVNDVGGPTKAVGTPVTVVGYP